MNLLEKSINKKIKKIRFIKNERKERIMNFILGIYSLSFFFMCFFISIPSLDFDFDSFVKLLFSSLIFSAMITFLMGSTTYLFFDKIFKKTNKKIQRKDRLLFNKIMNKESNNIYDEISKYYITKRYNKGMENEIKNNIKEKIEFLYENNIENFLDLKEVLSSEISSNIEFQVYSEDKKIIIEIKKEILNLMDRCLIKNKILEKDSLVNNKSLMF